MPGQACNRGWRSGSGEGVKDGERGLQSCDQYRAIEIAAHRQRKSSLECMPPTQLQMFCSLARVPMRLWGRKWSSRRGVRRWKVRTR